VSRRAPGRRPPLRPDLPRSARGQGTEVRAQHDVRVQHLEQRLEVAVPCGRQKGVDDFALSVEGGVGNRVLALDSATRAAGELTCRLGRAVDDRRDLVEGQGEMSCSTNASRLDGLRSSTTSSARPTESASSASCSGSIPSARSTIGSGMWTPSGSSLRTLRERSMFSETRATTVPIGNGLRRPSERPTDPGHRIRRARPLVRPRAFSEPPRRRLADSRMRQPGAPRSRARSRLRRGRCSVTMRAGSR
jgi:hypothetical protein